MEIHDARDMLCVAHAKDSPLNLESGMNALKCVRKKPSTWDEALMEIKCYGGC